jgi:hypothetical protein
LLTSTSVFQTGFSCRADTATIQALRQASTVSYKAKNVIPKMEVYNDDILIKDALSQMFDRFNIPANAYTAKSFIIRVGKIPIHVPNIPARIKIARYHDIHHIITGYPADWRGEAEIGAWEIATGCRKSFIAWFLNSGAVIVGLFMHPKAVLKAFQRGRNTRTNLYHDFEYEPLLSMTVKEVREKIGLAEY